MRKSDETEAAKKTTWTKRPKDAERVEAICNEIERRKGIKPTDTATMQHALYYAALYLGIEKPTPGDVP